MTTNSERNLSFDEIIRKREAEFERDYGFTGKASPEYVPLTPDELSKHEAFDNASDEEFNTTTFGPLKHAPWHRPNDTVELTERGAEQDRFAEAYDMAVGDINSNAKGSGARANGDKVPMDLIPVSVWRNKWRIAMTQSVDSSQLLDIMYALEKWQEGEYKPLDKVLSFNCLEGACRVFAYGAGKYAAWNWAKGMAWSVPLGCALRHMQAVLDGEFIDDESGLPHIDHVFSNLVMLDYFETHYPEGDDRPIFEEYNV
jgi:hypothetical protein